MIGKRFLAGFLALTLLLSMASCGKETEKIDETVLRVTDMKVNNLDTPLGIDTVPLFGWTNKSITTGRLQTAGAFTHRLFVAMRQIKTVLSGAIDFSPVCGYTIADKGEII